jgi:hypothetical protein
MMTVIIAVSSEDGSHIGPPFYLRPAAGNSQRNRVDVSDEPWIVGENAPQHQEAY